MEETYIIPFSLREHDLITEVIVQFPKHKTDDIIIIARPHAINVFVTDAFIQKYGTPKQGTNVTLYFDKTQRHYAEQYKINRFTISPKL